MVLVYGLLDVTCMRRNFFLAFVVGALGIGGCGSNNPAPPVGTWTFSGMVPAIITIALTFNPDGTFSAVEQVAPPTTPAGMRDDGQLQRDLRCLGYWREEHRYLDLWHGNGERSRRLRRRVAGYGRYRGDARWHRFVYRSKHASACNGSIHRDADHVGPHAGLRNEHHFREVRNARGRASPRAAKS